MSSHDHQGTDLLVAGARYYPQAFVAIREYRRNIREAWRTVLESRLGKISKVMAISLDSDKLIDHAIPESFRSSHASADWAQLGLKIKTPQWRIYFLVEFEEEKTYMWIQLRVAGEDKAQAVYEMLMKRLRRPFEIHHKKSVLALYREISPDQMRHLEKACAQICDEWCFLWKGSGGLNKIASKT